MLIESLYTNVASHFTKEDGGFGVELLHVLERHQRLALLDRFQVPEPAGYAFTFCINVDRVTLHKR